MSAPQILEKSRTVSLVLPFQAQTRDKQTAFLFACGLKKLGKQVSLEYTDMPLTSSSSDEKTFVVSLKGLGPWISRVRYEKEGKDLKLYFSLTQGEISPTTLSLQIQGQEDRIIIVGNKSPQNNKDEPSSTAQLSDKEAKQPLLDLLSSQKDPQTRLLGLILAKIEYISQSNTFLAVLYKEDFRGTRSSSKNLPLLISTLRESFGDQSSYLFFFDSSQGAQGMLWSRSSQLQAKFRDIAKAEQKGPWILLHPTPLSSEQLKHAFIS